jgi:hypothetical protein
MQRRKFIKNTLAGLPLIFLAPSLLANSCSSEDETETLTENLSSLLVREFPVLLQPKN